MRAISADQDAILVAGQPKFIVRLSTEDAGAVFRDLTDYAAGNNMQLQVIWRENVDDEGISWEAHFLREDELLSLAPLMQTSGLNRDFNPANAFAPLLQVGRRVKVEWAMQAEDSGAAPTWNLGFTGYIDAISWGEEDELTLSGRGDQARLVQTFIERERVYAFAQGGNATKGCYIFAPSVVCVVGDLFLPTDAKRNDHFYKVTGITTGIAAVDEPAWPVGAGANVVSGGVTFTEAGATSSVTGTALETILQQLLNDNGTGTTLSTPVSPAWLVRKFLVERQPLFDELRRLADEIGWCIRPKYDAGSGTMKLTLFDPNRANVTSARTFPKADTIIKRAAVEIFNIRNVVRVIFCDSQDLDPAGNPKRKYVEVSDATSIAKYGRLFCEIAEADTSNIDTTGEATTLANAVLSDLKEPNADFEFEVRLFPFAETTDLYTLAANGVHFDQDQKLAVVEYEHSHSADESITIIKVRGKPASGHTKWLQRQTDAENGEQHQLTAAENFGLLSLFADASPVGGTRVSLAWQGGKAPRDNQFELHLSKAPGFTPDSTTLAATGKDRYFEVGNLLPLTTYYAKVIPVAWNGQKPVRGGPSAEISFVAGQAQAVHLNADVVWGRLPLNGGFETQLDPAAAPDFWTMGGGIFGTWGVNGFVLTDANGISGQRYLKLISSAALVGGGITTAFFNVNEQAWIAPSFWRKAVSGAGTAFANIQFYDQNHNLTGASANEQFQLNTSVGTWTKYQFAALLPPAGTRYAKIQVAVPGGTAPLQECHFDDVVAYDEERWHNVGGGGTNDPAFTNTGGIVWQNFGNPYAPARFKRTLDGWVTMEGLVKLGTAGTTVFTLPVGYRPAANCNIYTAQVNNNALGVVEVQTGGAVVHQAGGSNVHLSLQARWLAGA